MLMVGVAMVIAGQSLFSICRLGIHNIGSYYPLFFSSQLLVAALVESRQRTVFWGVIMVILVQLLVATILSYRMRNVCRQYTSSPSGDWTVIILGCYCQGMVPGALLKNRLDLAVAWLKKHPQSDCIVAGGQGANELYPEAIVMAAYLREAGIALERIIEESHSHNTRDNCRFSKQIIEKCQLTPTVILVSNDFHLSRTVALWQESEDAAPCAILAAKTPPLYQQTYWVREWFAVLTDSRRRLG